MTTVIVAWSAAVYEPIQSRSRLSTVLHRAQKSIGIQNKQQASRSLYPWRQAAVKIWPIQVSSNWPKFPSEAAVEYGIGWTTQDASAGLDDSLPKFYTVLKKEYGFPLRCLTAYGTTVVPKQAIGIPHETQTPVIGSPMLRALGINFLPILWMWQPFVTNVAIYFFLYFTIIILWKAAHAHAVRPRERG